MLKVLSRRRERNSTPLPADGDPRMLLRALEEIQLNSATGRMTVETARGSRAHLYLYEGELYAVDLQGYQPPVDKRLQSGALLDSAQVDELTSADPTSSPAQRARTAAARQWIAVEGLGSIHQEFVLAAFGATLQAQVISTSFFDGSATGDVCALPLPLNVLIDAAAIRQTRLEEDWSLMHGLALPEDCIVRPEGSHLPPDCELPEFITVFRALDGEKSLARVAFDCGYTLAEIVHLVSALTVRGLAVVVGSAEEPATQLLVPEGFWRIEALVTSAAESEEANEELEPQLDSAVDSSEVNQPASPEPQDLDLGRSHSHDAAFVEALHEELARAESHVAAIRAQLEQIGAVLADA